MTSTLMTLYFMTEWNNYVLCSYTRKQQSSDKTVLVITSQMGQFFRHHVQLKFKGKASCTMSYQLVASTSCHFTADGEDPLMLIVRL